MVVLAPAAATSSFMMGIFLSRGVRAGPKELHVFRRAEHELVATKRTLHQEFCSV